MNSSQWQTVAWQDNSVVLLDQTRLPAEEVYVHCRDVTSVAEGIRNMIVRGAPAIGITAAMGVALAAHKADSKAEAIDATERSFAMLADTRPTAVNLFWALDRMRNRFASLAAGDLDELRAGLLEEAQSILSEDIQTCRDLGFHGAELIESGARILTHCNAGALATGGYGTALGVIRAAVEMGKSLSVLADETRPFLQGARLTAWELQRDDIDVTVITDNMAGHLISRSEVDCVIVGSDRTVANGDVANKIGTYTLAVLCKAHNIPFYAAVPTSTIDLSIEDGSRIPIEERPASEVEGFGGFRTVPYGVPVRNPAFDVTPAELVTAIITECGIARPPYSESLPPMVARSAEKNRATS